MADDFAGNGPNLAFAIGLEPEKAVEHLQSKGLKVSAGWRTVKEAAHARAFTVANVTRLDVLKDIQDELVRAQKAGQTMQQFRDNLIPTLTKKGWFAAKGQPVRVPDGSAPDPLTGELTTQKRLTARRLKTIFQTNMQSSMMAGRYRELMANVDKRPFFQYVAILDGRTRPAHRAMNGRVFRYDDAGWSTWWPPCGWNCRCRVRALDGADLTEKGLTAESSAGHTKTTQVPMRDGSTSTVTRYSPPGGQSFAPDPGFNGNPAQVQAADRLMVLRAPEVLPPSVAAAELRSLFTDPKRVAEIRSFVNTAREAQLVAGAKVGMGSLDDAAVLKLNDEGRRFDQAQPITLSDELVRSKPELAPEAWAAATEALAYGSIGWDARASTLIYVRRAANDLKGSATRVTVQAGPEGNVVRSVEVLRDAEIPAPEFVRSPIAN